MNYNNRTENDSTMTMRVVCAVAFVTFTLAFLFFRQADVLAVAQHVLSGGRTVYEPTIGALLITLVLFGVQKGAYRLFPICRRMHWTTYFPSFLLLTVLTDISPEIDLHFSLGTWLWLFPLLLPLWILPSFVSKNIQQ